MGADPEPDYGVVFPYAHGPVIPAHSSRVDRLRGVHTFEVQSWMVRVFGETSVSLSCSVLNMRR
ncbi:MAG: hypothetical protein AVDCRST_MAG93-3217 [uncultured Chloroflexia bacterium]|uniref:Uncharacterized protein n=1 Tax=uncultured Chloroflexia bacterium TaxID=1672391 RepID=A0A6J4JL72_9CHLR|nr:MAG: hypothetical protein AVDCRST_MAG93-3217 [uncultured Chloroflexia bacterium]